MGKLFLLGILAISILLLGCTASGGNYAPAQQAPQAPPSPEPQSPQVPQPPSAEPQGSAEIVSLNSFEQEGLVKIFGEVKNTGSVPIKNIQARVIYSGPDGTEKAISRQIEVCYLEPGAKGPFWFQLNRSAIGNLDGIKAEVESFEFSKAVFNGLQVAEHIGQETEGSWKGNIEYDILGNMTNADGKPASSDWLEATLYDAQGKVIGASEDFIGYVTSDGVIAKEEKTLAPGATRPFRMQAYHPKGTEVASYALSFVYWRVCEGKEEADNTTQRIVPALQTQIPQEANNTTAAEPAPPEPEGKLELVRSYYYVTDLGWYFITGLVNNTGTVPIQFVRAKVTYYLADGTPDTGEYIVHPSYLAPNETGGFVVTVGTSGNYDIGKYEADAGSFVVTEASADSFSIGNQKLSASSSYPTASAEITNTGTAPSTTSWANAIFYDADGNVLETGTDVLGTGLKPGAISKVSFTVRQPSKTIRITSAEIRPDYGS